MENTKSANLVVTFLMWHQPIAGRHTPYVVANDKKIK